MKTHLLISAFILFASILSTALANTVEDYLLRNLDESSDGLQMGGELWTGRKNEPQGGYLFKMRFDLDGGQRLEFISSSIFADRFLQWSIYLVSSNRKFKLKYDDFETSAWPSFYWDSNSHSLSEVYTDKKIMNIITYKFNMEGNWTKHYPGGEERDFGQEDINRNYLFEQENILVRKYALGRQVNWIKKILLSEYLRNPKAEWRNVLGYDLGVQSMDIADKEALLLNEKFTPDKALEMWRTWKQQSWGGVIPPAATIDREKTVSPVLPKPLDTVARPEIPLAPQDQLKQPPARDFLWRWVTGVIFLAVVAGGLCVKFLGKN